jgi:hypothetical protein
MYRQIEIKIRRSMAAETPRPETVSLPEPGAPVKQRSPEGSSNR